MTIHSSLLPRTDEHWTGPRSCSEACSRLVHAAKHSLSFLSGFKQLPLFRRTKIIERLLEKAARSSRTFPITFIITGLSFKELMKNEGTKCSDGATSAKAGKTKCCMSNLKEHQVTA